MDDSGYKAGRVARNYRFKFALFPHSLEFQREAAHERQF